MNCNSKKLIIGRIIGNFADSLFMIIFPIALYKAYDDYSVLYFYSTISLTLSSLSFLITPIVNKYNKKTMLITCQVLQFILILVMIISLNFDNYLSLIAIYLSSGLFTVSNLLSYILQSAMIPEITEEEKLFKVNQVMQTSLFAVNMLADSISAIILIILTINEIATISVILYIITIIVFKRIRYKKVSVEITNDEVVLESSQSNVSYKESLKSSLRLVLSNDITRSIILMLFVSGVGYQYLITYIPAYFVDLGNDYMYSIFNLVLFLGLIVGTTLSEHIYKRKATIFIGSITLFAILMFISTNHLLLIFSFVFLLSVYSGSLEPIIMTCVQQSLKDEVSIGITAIMAISSISKLIGIQISAFVIGIGGFNLLYTGYFILFLFDVVFTYRFINKSKGVDITFDQSNE